MQKSEIRESGLRRSRDPPTFCRRELRFLTCRDSEVAPTEKVSIYFIIHNNKECFSSQQMPHANLELIDIVDLTATIPLHSLALSSITPLKFNPFYYFILAVFNLLITPSMVSDYCGYFFRIQKTKFVIVSSLRHRIFIS